MRRCLVLLLIVTLVLGIAGVASAYFGKIGTAHYTGTNYNLIYEGTLGGQGLVWLDYSHPTPNSYGYPGWYQHDLWTATLSLYGDVTLDPEFTSTIGWNSWRMPRTDESVVNLSGGFGYAGPDGNESLHFIYTSPTSTWCHLNQFSSPHPLLLWLRNLFPSLELEALVMLAIVLILVPNLE